MKRENDNRGYISRGVKVLGVVAGGTLAAAAIVYCAREQDSSPNTPDTTVEPTTTARQLEQPSAEAISPQAVRNLYNLEKETISGYFDLRRQGITTENIRAKSKEFTILKARTVWGADPFPESPTISNDGNILIFNNGRQLNLDKPTDFVLGTAVVDYLFHSRFEEYLQDEISFWFDRQRLTPYEGLENIFWLKDNIEIEMGDIPPVARTESLEQLTRGLMFMQEAGIELPTKAKIEAFGFEDSNIYENVDDDTLLLQVFSYPDGDFRVATSLTDYIIARNPDILKNYKGQVEVAFNSQTDEITEPKLLSSNDYGYVYDDEGELPIILADFIYDGSGFRKKIEYAMATGHIVEGNILQAKYDYARQVLGGIETSEDGRKRILSTYNAGDIVTIADYEDASRPGIFLRETPTLEIDPERPAVYDGWKVQVVDGPVLYIDDVNLEATRMWRVQEGTVANGRVFVGDNDRTGWISEEWFGEKLKITN